jgi:hypothetical protein
MATSALTTITNISNQVIPVLVNDIPSSSASASSDIAANISRQLSIAPGAEMTVETRRLDEGQLRDLAQKRLISYVST